jgi:choline dehydrogenase-like flavoprotein
VTDHYVVIVRTGAGGGTLANVLAQAGRRILPLERGDFLTRGKANWDPEQVFVDGRYISPDTWYDADGRAFQPQVHNFVGGATKMYGAALYRLRPADFGEIQHADGLSPAWPVGYDDFEVYQGRMALPGPRRARRGSHRGPLVPAVPVAHGLTLPSDPEDRRHAA